MFSFFGGSSSYDKKDKKGKKKKGTKDKQEIVKQFVNPVKNILMNGFSKMGYGGKKTECQDSFCIMEQFADDCFFFAVYDGHGSSGKEASQAANDYIQTTLEQNVKKIKNLSTDKDRYNFLKSTFKTTEQRLKASGIDYSNSGTCCISVLVIKNIIYVANLGDSRAVLYRRTHKDKLAIEMSYDQKPTRADEKERIIRCGGKIERLIHDGQQVGPQRVWADEEGPGIAMTRTLGDLQAKKIGLISEPEIQHIELNPKQDKFMIIGSDGLWDVMTSGDAVGFVNEYEPQEKVSEALVNEARSRWDELNKTKKNSSKVGDVPYLKYGCDDITAVVAFFEYIEEAL